MFIAHAQAPLAFARRVRGFVPNPTGTELFKTVELR